MYIYVSYSGNQFIDKKVWPRE